MFNEYKVFTENNTDITRMFKKAKESFSYYDHWIESLTVDSKYKKDFYEIYGKTNKIIIKEYVNKYLAEQKIYKFHFNFLDSLREEPFDIHLSYIMGISINEEDKEITFNLRETLLEENFLYVFRDMINFIQEHRKGLGWTIEIDYNTKLFTDVENDIIDNLCRYVSTVFYTMVVLKDIDNSKKSYLAGKTRQHPEIEYIKNYIYKKILNECKKTF